MKVKRSRHRFALTHRYNRNRRPEIAHMDFMQNFPGEVYDLVTAQLGTPSLEL